MKYAAIKYNDIVDGEGVCVSYWCQGCPFHCEGCHNPQTWNFGDGYEQSLTFIINDILSAIVNNNIHRNLSILGGEPLCNENVYSVMMIVSAVRTRYPNIKIFLWTGYTLEELKERNSLCVNFVLRHIDVLIDGRFELDKRDITLNLRGSSNQRVLYKGVDF